MIVRKHKHVREAIKTTKGEHTCTHTCTHTDIRTHANTINLTWTYCLDSLWPVLLAWLTLLNTPINMTRPWDQSCLGHQPPCIETHWLQCVSTHTRTHFWLREGSVSLTIMSSIRAGGLGRVSNSHKSPWQKSVLLNGAKGQKLFTWLPLT